MCEAVEGGIAEYAVRQSEALAEVGVEVTFLCRPDFPSHRIQRAKLCPDLPPRSRGSRGLRRLISRITEERRIVRAVCRYARENDHKQILFACYYEYFSPLWAGFYRELASEGVVIGTIAHDPVRDFVAGPVWWHRLSIRQAYSFVGHVYTHDRREVDFGGRKPEAISTHVIPHGPFEFAAPATNREQLRADFGYGEDDKVFLSFGHVRDGKNLDRFLHAMTKLDEQVKLMVAGSAGGGSQRPPSYYMNLAEELKVDGRCSWDIRHIDDDEITRLFSAADFILLTYSSSFHSASGVLNTAVACRKLVLASSGDGPLREVVESYGLGLFIEPDDDAAIVAGVDAIIRRDGGGEPQWESYENDHSWRTNANKIIETMLS